MESKTHIASDSLNACSECVKKGKTIDRLCSAIEELRETEGVNREALQVTSRLLQVIPIGLLIYQYQPQGELFYFGGNPEGIRLLGASPNGSRGAEFDEMWPNARMQGLTEALMNTAQTGELLETDSACFRKDLTERVFRLRAFSLAGNLLGILLQESADGIQCAQMPANSPEDLEKTLELGPVNPFSGGRIYPTDVVRKDSLEIQANNPDDFESSDALAKLAELLQSVEAMAQRVLSRLDSGYLSLARASVEHVIEDIEQALGFVALLGRARPTRPTIEAIREAEGTESLIGSVIPGKTEKGAR